IIEFLPDATLVINAEKKVIAWNRAIETMTGVNKKDMIGRGDYAYAVPFYGRRRPILIDLVGMHDRMTEAKYSYVKRVGDTLYAEVFVSRLFDGKGAFIWVKASPLYDSEGAVVGAIESVRDITERKQAEEVLRRDKEVFERLVEQHSTELLRAQKELAENKRLSDIGTLAATVAHELRNPLGVILTAAYNIKMKSDDKGIRKHLVNIEKKIFESNQIINNLLNYARIKMPEYRRVRIDFLLNECVMFAKKRFRSPGITVEKAWQDVKGKFVQVDPVQIREVFNNILNNAFQAVRDKKGRIRVSAGVDPQGFLRISVKDNGVGMDEKELGKIFDPFYTTKPKGTGLGLTISKDLVELHGGRIYIETKHGQGTSITVKLPVEKPV
ncbi:MAG: ATP-binding protein, partial [Candidatus Omnitrophica bacterium]|nr:ATP-binding protein [Candidatus Omnitrophota bacterium]